MLVEFFMLKSESTSALGRMVDSFSIGKKKYFWKSHLLCIERKKMLGDINSGDYAKKGRELIGGENSSWEVRIRVLLRRLLSGR